MKKSVVLFLLVCGANCFSGKLFAHNLHKSEGDVELKPTYLDVPINDWRRNWFLEVKGGATAFLGSPLGCGDLGDRLKPALQVGVGKWFVPSAGVRLSYQGLTFKDAAFTCNNYHSLHGDLLINVNSFLKTNQDGMAKWDFVPYLGTGIIYNSDKGKKNFSLHYGIMARWRISSCFRLVGEVGGLSTFSDFDGVGRTNEFGDNMIHLTFGINMTLGKIGWKKVVDAAPYMQQNRQLIDKLYGLETENEKMAKMLQKRNAVLKEYRKILEIEGLLKKYKTVNSDSNEYNAYPRNNYSGLNSLRARLMDKNMEKDSSRVFIDSLKNEFVSLFEGNQGIGAPIYFFFRIGTTTMIDNSQKLNLDEVAKVVTKYGLFVSIEGAADSATGTQDINDKLSNERATYIKGQLKQRGVPEEKIRIKAKGGVEEYDSKEANRHTKVTLFFK